MTLVKRLVNILVIMFGVSIIIFGLTRVLPGDPIAAAMGDMPSDAHIERMRSEMGLDKPIVLQYVDFVVGLSKGRMGLSITERRDVAEIVVQRLPATIELVTAAILLSLVIGVPLGVISAKYKGRPGDHISRTIALFGSSIPNFWIAIMIQMIFGLFFALLPITGRITGPPPDAITGLYVVDSILTLNATALRDSIRHLAAPAFVLASGPIASIALMLRAKMIDESAKPYSELAAALGMHPLIISYKYLLRNSFSATLTLIGFLFPILIGANFIVEKVFAWPGIARYGADAIIANDFNGVVGVTMVVCFFVVVINQLVNLAYPLLDPRIRLGGYK